MSGLVKICGLSTPETLEAALEAGADMVGFVRFPRSPRHVARDLGADLSSHARGRAGRVLLVVDPDDESLEEDVAALDPDVIQLHGHETPARAAAIRARYGRAIIKAIGIGGAADLPALSTFRAADHVLLDAKPPAGAALPGGNGRAFDWRILAEGPAADSRETGLDRTRLMLSGGLTADNVAAAILDTGVRAVDVSSCVETRPGLKDSDLIRAFVAAARSAWADAATRTNTA